MPSCKQWAAFRQIAKPLAGSKLPDEPIELGHEAILSRTHQSEQAPHPQWAKRWEHFAHGADIGVRGFGPLPAAAIEQATLAMMGVITDPTKVEPCETVEVTVEAPSLDLLLVDWLNSLVFQMATRGMIFGRFEVAIDGHRLFGRAHGEPLSREKHEPAVEVKGATLTELAVVQDRPGEWRAQCVVDV